MIWTLFDILSAGTDTVSTFMVWSVLFMIKYPNIQQKVSIFNYLIKKYSNIYQNLKMSVFNRYLQKSMMFLAQKEHHV